MTQLIKISLIAIASAIAGAYAMHHLYPIDNADTQNHEQHKALQQLQSENDQLRALISQQQYTAEHTPSVAKKINLPQNDAAPIDAHQLDNSDAESHPSEQPMAENEFSRWMTQANKASTNFDLGAEMQRRFEAEPIDQQWAEKQEQEYLSLFTENKELAGVAFRDSQCRSKQCAISIGITDIEQANQLVEKVSSALQAQKKYSLIVAAPDPQQGVTKLYIGKDAQSFGFNE
ncbi:MAG: hypothetical protein AAGC78_18580 [Cellvibrio sp.]|uniref:hypothetical protein n=1 Tax=Cellvibrio sp. TaxID=1965322 RepID=UPI0031AC214C